MFLDEKSFKNESSDFAITETHNNLESYSFFTETVEEMLNRRFINEGYIQDIIADINDIYKANQHYLSDGLLAICKANQDILKNQVRIFCGDFSSLYREKIRWFNEHKKELENFSGDSIKPYDGIYNYTYISDSRVPNMKYLRDILSDVIKMKQEIKGGTDAEKRLSIDIEHSRIYDMIHTEQYYNKARGYVFVTEYNQSPKSIKSDDFPSEIFNFFRDGGDMISKEFSAKDIRIIASKFNKYSSFVPNIRNELATKDKIYNDINSHVKDLEHYSKSMINDEELLDSFNKYIIQLQDQIYMISSIISITFAGKLDAITRSFLQDCNVLERAVATNKSGGEIIE